MSLYFYLAHYKSLFSAPRCPISSKAHSSISSHQRLHCAILHANRAGGILRAAPAPRSHLPPRPPEPSRRSCPISAHTPQRRGTALFPHNSTIQSVTQSTQLEMELLLHPESFRAPFYKTNIVSPIPQFNKLPNICSPDTKPFQLPCPPSTSRMTPTLKQSRGMAE